MITAAPQIDQGKALALFRQFDDGELWALRNDGGALGARMAELVLGERSHQTALQQELAKARADAAVFKAHVDSYRESLQKAPTGTARTELEDLLKQYETRLSGALDNVQAVERELKE